MSNLPKTDIWGDMMRQALQGNQHIYKVLLEALSQSLRRQVRASLARFGRSTGDAEDIVQEVLLAVHLKKHTWDSTLPFAPWVNAIARYKMTDAFRRGGVRITLPIDDIVLEIPAVETKQDDYSDAERLISQLETREQQIVRAISLNGASFKDVSESLQMREGAVRVALHRALVKLAKIYRKSLS